MTEFLHPTEDNPVPADAVSGMLALRDGKRIRYARFAATGRPLKGTVVVFAGRNECIEKYFETVRDLAARGFGVAMIDWRGQGGSDRMLRGKPRGYVRDFGEYVSDMEEFWRDVVLPDCRAPFYALGHSTGALIALLAAPRLATQLRRMVLAAPLLEFADMPTSMKRTGRLARALAMTGFGRVPMPGSAASQPAPFAYNKLTSDPLRYARNVAIYRAHPELATGRPTVAWVGAVCRAVETVSDPGFMARLPVPTLIVAAGSDEVVSTLAIQRYTRRLKANAAITIDGARHEMLQEADVYRQQFFAAFDAFVPGSDLFPVQAELSAS